MITNLRSTFARLAGNLLDEGKPRRAINVLDRAMEIMPHETIPYNYFIVPRLRNYYRAGEEAKATAIAIEKSELLKKELNYYITLDKSMQKMVEFEIHQALSVYQELLEAVTGNNQELEMQFNADLNSYYEFLMGG